MTEPRSLRGLVVAVTGAGHGIGSDIARGFAGAGARVALGDVDLAAAQRAAERLGGGAVGLPLDVTDTGSFTRFLDDVSRALGPLDVLVNNAGVMWVGPYDREPDHVAQRQLDVNVLGVVRGVRLAAPRMAARGQGQIVTIASAASRVSPPGEATYAASKHAVLGYLTAVRAELRGSGVVLSMVMPGVVDTELAAGTRTGPVRRLKPHDVTAAVLDVVARPRFEVTVPRRIGLLHRLAALLPQRPRDLLLRLTVPDQVAAMRRDAARRAREGYERSRFD